MASHMQQQTWIFWGENSKVQAYALSLIKRFFTKWASVKCCFILKKTKNNNKIHISTSDYFRWSQSQINVKSNQAQIKWKLKFECDAILTLLFRVVKKKSCESFLTHLSWVVRIRYSWLTMSAPHKIFVWFQLTVLGLGMVWSKSLCKVLDGINFAPVFAWCQMWLYLPKQV